jgi:hypothetical protein
MTSTTSRDGAWRRAALVVEFQGSRSDFGEAIFAHLELQDPQGSERNHSAHSPASRNG